MKNGGEREVGAANVTLLSLLMLHQSPDKRSKPKITGFAGFEGPGRNSCWESVSSRADELWK